jgi:hypothetical protein
VSCAAGDVKAPMWPLSFLNNLANYIFSSGNAFAAADHMNLNGPIAIAADPSR